MNFHEQLCEYMDVLSCTGKMLAVRSGLSAAVVSRYRNGERTPARGSEQLRKLSAALCELAGPTLRRP